MNIQTLPSTQYIPNLPPRQKYEDVYFNALRNDDVTIKELTGDKIVLSNGDVESFYQFDNNGNAIFVSSFNKKTNEGKNYIYHNLSSSSPSMKVVQYGKDFQAVRVKTDSDKYSSLASTVYTRKGDSSQVVTYNADGSKDIYTDRRNLKGEWNFDSYPEHFNEDKQINFWV